MIKPVHESFHAYQSLHGENENTINREVAGYHRCCRCTRKPLLSFWYEYERD